MAHPDDLQNENAEHDACRWACVARMTLALRGHAASSARRRLHCAVLANGSAARICK
jgi:hypothetical protein